jgi:hypothetical protein
VRSPVLSLGAWIAVPVALAVALALALGGCGGSSAHHSATHTTAEHRKASAPTPCAASSREAVARFLALAPANVSAATGTGNNGFPQCTFSAHPAHTRRVSAIANLYDGPQPYFLLERQAVETAQLFGPKRTATPPIAILNLGIEADWFPDLGQLLSTDGLRLITVTMHWPGVRAARQIALAEALSRTYLKKLTPQQVDRVARGAPCDC